MEEAIGEILLGFALVVESFYLSNKLNCNPKYSRRNGTHYTINGEDDDECEYFSRQWEKED